MLTALAPVCCPSPATAPVQPTAVGPVIHLTVTPQSGNAPLSVQAVVSVEHAAICQVIFIKGGVESPPDPFPCAGITITRKLTATMAFKVTAFSQRRLFGNRLEATKMAVATVTP